MMAYTDLAEAQAAQSFFATLNGRQRFQCYRPAIFNPRREAGRSWLVPDAQSRLASQFPDVSLGQAGGEQGSSDVMLPGRGLTRAKIALIIQIHAIGD